VALADKIDMVCGCFGVGLIPTGTADPYALRRQTLGILLILEARGLRIPIGELVDRSLATLAGKLKTPAAEVREKVLEFFAGRIANLWGGKGVPGDLVDAALSPGLTDVVDLKARLDALVELWRGADFEPLAEVFKRAINISKGYAGPGEVSPALFEHAEEGALLSALDDVAGRVEAAARTGAYGAAFREMAALRAPVASFFEKVLVMAKDENVRNNRLALLSRLSGTFARVADFSRVTVGQSK
jgi:glycyl-tRNA synthetase beta chain